VFGNQVVEPSGTGLRCLGITKADVANEVQPVDSDTGIALEDEHLQLTVILEVAGFGVNSVESFG
jgi:hypothetical protein